MNYLALYRKYRPNKFEDVFGQDKVIKVIKNEIVNDRISHAYLFCGPRGTGKTTTAKIIAKLVNCINLVDGDACGKCPNCLNYANSSDIIEIDAASNNGVDEIRELIDKVNLVPTSGRFKIYIIDEVHMLTTSAFNALLKTLEEPPSHIIFILATTEPHKIPLTITSRCQKFQFSKISVEEIFKRIKFIAENEKVVVEDDVLMEVARLSDGGLRDAINMLDQLIAYKDKNITLNDVYNINGTVSYNDLYNFIKYMMDNRVSDIINYIEQIDNEGKNITKFVNELIIFLKDILLYKNANILCEIVDKQDKISSLSSLLNDDVIYNIIYSFNDAINDMKLSNNGVIIFTVCVLKVINDNFSGKKANLSKKTVEKEVFTEDNLIKKEKLPKEDEKKEILKTEKDEKYYCFINTRVNNTFVYANKNELLEIKKAWKKINDYLLESKYGINCGILKDVEVVAAGGNYLILSSSFDSIVEKINTKVKDFEDTLLFVFDKKYKIVCLTSSMWTEEKNKYIKNIKEGKKCSLIDEINENKEKEKEPVDELIDLIGEEFVEIK